MAGGGGGCYIHRITGPRGTIRLLSYPLGLANVHRRMLHLQHLWLDSVLIAPHPLGFLGHLNPRLPGQQAMRIVSNACYTRSTAAVCKNQRNLRPSFSNTRSQLMGCMHIKSARH